MKELTFEPCDMRTHFFVPINLAKEYKSMAIDFSYSPKEIGDAELAEEIIRETLKKYAPEKADGDVGGFFPVTNLLTLSLDYENDYIGCAHRGAAEQQINITAESASPGFVPHAVSPGDWCAVLTLHAVSVPVTCKIQIRGQ